MVALGTAEGFQGRLSTGHRIGSGVEGGVSCVSHLSGPRLQLQAILSGGLGQGFQ